MILSKWSLEGASLTIVSNIVFNEKKLIETLINFWVFIDIDMSDWNYLYIY